MIPRLHIHHLAHHGQLFSAHCKVTLLARLCPCSRRLPGGSATCVVRANEGLSHPVRCSPSPPSAPEALEEGKELTLRLVCVHGQRGEWPHLLTEIITRPVLNGCQTVKGPEPVVNSPTIWGYIYHQRLPALQTVMCVHTLGRGAPGRN